MLRKKTFEIARDTGNHLLVQLKENQPNPPEAVCTIADNSVPADTAVSLNNGRSRQEDRTVEVFPVGKTLAATEWQPFVKTIIRVTRRTLLRSADTGVEQPCAEPSRSSEHEKAAVDVDDRARDDGRALRA